MDSTHASHTFTDFTLQSGEVLPEVTIGYVTRGPPSTRRAQRGTW